MLLKRTVTSAVKNINNKSWHSKQNLSLPQIKQEQSKIREYRNMYNNMVP